MEKMICLEGMYFFKKDIRFIFPCEKRLDIATHKSAKTTLCFYDSPIEIHLDSTVQETIKLLGEI